MQVLMIRHSKTKGNEEHRYIGRTDQPLSENGIELARETAKLYEKEFPEPDKVYVTPLIRTQMTAKILFPNARQIVVDGLREMDFGVFEGRSAAEMTDDNEYRTWVDGMCEGLCPGGESKHDFSERVCHAFKEVIDKEDSDRIVMVLHGGTIMSIAEKYALSKRSFYDTYLKNCRGIGFDVERIDGELRLTKEKIYEPARP